MQPSPPQPSTAERARIFIVEDDALIAMELQDRLERLGHQPCGAAARGEEAIQAIRQAAPDLVLMDVRLAGKLDGTQTAVELAQTLDVPVVYVTAFSDDETVQRIVGSHPYGYVVKPFDEQELHVAIQVALSKHRKERELREAAAQLEFEAREREGELAETRERLAFLLSRSPTVIYSRRPSYGGVLTYISPNVRQVLGLRPAALLAEPGRWSERIHPEDRERILKALASDAETLNLEYRIKNRTGEWRWIHDAMVRSPDEPGGAREAVGSWVDVTDRKRAEMELRALNTRLDAEVEARTQELRESEGFRRAILDSLSAHVAVLDEEGVIIATNQAWRDFARENGADPDAVNEGASYLGAGSFGPAASEKSATSLGIGVREVLAGQREHFELEYECQGPHSRSWFLARANRFRYGGRNRVVVSHEDVTPIHEALNTLHESQETLATLAQASPVGIFRTDEKGNCLAVNDRWCSIAGIPAETAMGEGWLAAVHPDDQSSVRRAWRRAVQKGDSFRSEFRFLRPDGETSWVLSQSSATRDPYGALSGHIGVVTDISDRKQVEDALQALSTDLAFARGPGYFAEAVRTLTRVLEVEVAFITEWERQRPDELTVLAWADEDEVREDPPFSLKNLPCQEAIFSEGLVIPDELGHRWPEAEWIHKRGLESYAAVPLKSASGAVVGLVAVAARLPMRKGEHVQRILEIFSVSASGELARRNEERRFLNVLDLAPDAILLTDDHGRIIMANQRTQELFGWSPDELKGESVEVLLPSELRQRHRHQRRGYVASGQARIMGAQRGDFWGMARDGRRIPVEVGLAGVETEGDKSSVIAIIRDVTERRRFQEALSTARANLNDALDSIGEGVILWDGEDRIVLTNRRALDFHPALAAVMVPGTAFTEVMESVLDQGVLSPPQTMTRNQFLELARKRHQQADGIEVRVRLPGERIWTVAHLPSHQGGRVTVLTDQTEKARTEEQFRRAQKMEALGKLTGGLAHDFNNYLGVIFGYLEVLREQTELSPRAQEYLDAALDGATRGAELTRSLLSFARKQPLQPRISDVGQTISETVHLIRRTLGEDVEVSLTLDPDLAPVRVDGEQLGSALVNLANNARDAMPDGGRLAISVSNVELDEAYILRHPYAQQGHHVLIQVSDTGEGMTPEARAQAFEPFFTTKPTGHGTGLGLSMVYGFVKQSGGSIDIYSELGVGTSVKIFLPQVQAPNPEGKSASDPSATPLLPRGEETVLVVEDNEEMRRSAALQIRSLGYRVFEAEDGESALAQLDDVPGEIHLLFTDVVMPGALDGKGLSQVALERHPELRILFTSGFSDDILQDDLELGSGVEFLSKPYRKVELAKALRRALAPPERPESA